MKTFRSILILFLIPYVLSGQDLETQLSEKATEALEYAKQNKMDTTLCILVDMSISSGKYRLFVWDHSKDSLLQKSLCSHGSCGGTNGPELSLEEPIFSNQPESYCSSLGKYRIGKRSYSNWGINIHYKLHGLEKTNSNAFRRIIVLHSFSEVPDNEVYPGNVVTSLGCPMVSNSMMYYLDELLKNRAESVLLWIYK